MEIVKCSYGGWDNCLEISNEQVKLVITLDVGPRVIFYGFIDGQNMFKTFDEQMGQTGGDELENLRADTVCGTRRKLRRELILLIMKLSLMNVTKIKLYWTASRKLIINSRKLLR